MNYKKVLKLCQKQIHKDIYRIREIDKRKHLFLSFRTDYISTNEYAYLVLIKKGMPIILDEAECLDYEHIFSYPKISKM